MFNKLIFLLLGISLILYGSLTIMKRGYYSSKFGFYFDFGPYHYVLGIIITIVGIFFVYTSLTKKAKEFEAKFLICPKCKAPFNQKEVPDGRCPECEVKLEDLDGFYERHPELKAK